MQKQMKRNQGGITLIALVITIIVLLILAGITINLVLGEHGIFGTAQMANKKMRYVSAKEMLELHLLDLQTECTKENKAYTIALIENTIRNLEDIDIVKYYYKGADIKGIAVSVKEYPEYNFLINEVGEIPKVLMGKINESTLEEQFKVIEEFELETFGEIITTTSKNKNGEEGFKATDLKANPSLYGSIVNNYAVDSSVTDTNIKWKIFYADDNNIYLIASDFIKVDNAPSKIKEGVTYSLTKQDEYRCYLDYSTVIEKNIYTIPEDIGEKMQNLNGEYFKYMSENNVAKAKENYMLQFIAFMMDTDIWSKYSMTNVADYAIGTPTIEQVLKSFNEKYNTNYIAPVSTGTGTYEVTGYSKTGNNIALNNEEEDSDTLYFLDKYLWLASPYITNGYLWYVSSDDSSLSTICWDGNFGVKAGLRPVICLKSDTVLIKEANGEFKIKL